VKIVIALGGNALLHRGEPAELAIQRRRAAAAARSIATVAAEHEVVVTHGNGPQVGLLALMSDAYREVHPYPLDVLGAESQGMIGYLLQQALRDAMPGRQVVTLLTEVEVDGQDPAFHHPSKPIGPVYSHEVADALTRDHGWIFAPDGEGWRRVVPSPEPVAIVELDAIKTLAQGGALVVCAGGGGIPMRRERDGGLAGVEAVIDKDLAACLLARDVAAEFLLLLTDVPGVYRDWGTAKQRLLRRASPSELRESSFAAGSMGPKVEAACRFVEATGGTAAIGPLARASAIIAGAAGTRIGSCPSGHRSSGSDG
jgi:carbamate kinase